MTTSPTLTTDQFDAFFEALHGYKPFCWQTRLALQACNGAWPRFIKLPTASGKTSCIDIAIFALAYQACQRHINGTTVNAPRRIFFVVDRRIIVNEAYRRASNIRDKLCAALTDRNGESPLFGVAWWLRSLADNENAPPLDCFELRGGIYRDDAWIRSMLQPTVLTSTVDQIGSRLLFRGYGVSDRNLPIHAALTANDALILLDEAHCSKPFSQTMEAIARYRDAQLAENASPRWAEEPITTPFQFIEMTATPNTTSTADVFELNDADYTADDQLEQRHGCGKPVSLVSSKASGAKQNQQLAKHLAEQTIELAKESKTQPACQRIAVVVNRIACARETYAILRNKFGERVQLMIGRMRPIDRDRLTGKLQNIFQSGSNQALTKSHFVVATQCLEVGADFDFDGMVCQCASLDALRQRFGRLNRLGRTLHARGVIVMATGDLSPKRPDPIYGESLPASWLWLQEQAEEDVIDFGVRSLDQLLYEKYAINPDLMTRLTAPAPNAPVLMPAHLDILSQTGPRPALEPDIAAYLHGPQRGIPEAQVCWRADLPQLPTNKADLIAWAKTCEKVVALCPPSSAECLNVSLPQLRFWLQGIEQSDESGDVIGEKYDAKESPGGDTHKTAASVTTHYGLIWSGQECSAVSGRLKKTLDSIYPNATIVLPASTGGWDFFGHIPNAPTDPSLIDVASEAFRQSRARNILRVHPAFATADIFKRAFEPLFGFAHDENMKWQHNMLKPSGTDEPDKDTDEHHRRREAFIVTTRNELYNLNGKRLRIARYPDGYVIIGPRISQTMSLPRKSFDDEHDEHNFDADQKLSLADHLADISEEVERLVSAIDLPAKPAAALVAAAERHDLGKADPRFQAMLLGSSLDMAWMQPKLWAKSARGTISAAQSKQNAVSYCRVDQLPSDFRHEMLSLEMARHLSDDLDPDSQDIMLHIIAAHHGHARPFAPVVIDDNPPAVSLEKLNSENGMNADLRINTEERLRLTPAHQLNSGISKRFWKLNRRFGWWGLAWLESTLRLADWVVSAQPKSAKHRILTTRQSDSQVAKPDKVFRLACPGLNGANPLGFLAAIGLFRTLSNALPEQRVKMAWCHTGIWHPTLLTDNKMTQNELITILQESLTGRENKPHFTAFGKNTTVPVVKFRSIAINAVNLADYRNRTFADFCAAFGSDALVSFNDGVTMQDTALRTMAGAGHQHFLETMQNLIIECTTRHLYKAIFNTWMYDDPTQTLSLRFDPLDDNRYALRWRNPSGDPDRKTSGSMLGANRLAIESFPLLPTAPGKKRLKTTGVTGYRSSDTFFHWPIWTVPLPISVLRSLLMSPDIISPDSPIDALTARGISAVMYSQRITVGKVRNFTPAKLKHAISASVSSQRWTNHKNLK